VTTQYGVLVLAGPKAREVLRQLTDADLSNEAFP
jgi:dimethylglycine dehydrogenase